MIIMKAILLAGVILASSTFTAVAQSEIATTTAPPQEQAAKAGLKEVFAEKVAKFSASFGETDQVRMNNFMELAALMQRAIYTTTEQMKKAEGTEQAKLKQTIDKQNGLYSQIKMLSGDGQKSQKQIEKKLEEFRLTM
jgi:hypothetical protein